ncbi:MAG: hypothetical protein DRR03_04330 [Gammaproteobacteria bacterium]|nr:MAG: hypothetical protein DRR03_04330 [Gammaproteobacteria bacterium]
MVEPRTHWLARPRTIRWIWIAFAGVLLLTLIPSLFIEQHEHFGLEGSFGFYAWFGLVTCAAMVVGAKVLGMFLKRPDDYYDD